MADQKEIVWGAAAFVGAGVVLAAYWAAPPRYAVTRMNDGAAYRIDRHSGEMSLCFGFECRPVTEKGEVQPAGEAAATAESAGNSLENPAWRECVTNARDAVEAVKCKELM